MDIDDLLNGLPTKPPPFGANRPKLGSPSAPTRKSTTRRRPAPPAPPPPAATPTTPAPGHPPIKWKYYRVPRWLVWAMVAGLVGAAVATHDSGQPRAAPASHTPEAAAMPAATVTVTVTKTETVTALPESCKRVIVLMRDLLDDMNNLNSRSAEQMDIANDASQAIFKKDWQALHGVEDRQRRLSQTQESAYQDFKAKYQPALDAMDQCMKDGK